MSDKDYRELLIRMETNLNDMLVLVRAALKTPKVSQQLDFSDAKTNWIEGRR